MFTRALALAALCLAAVPAAAQPFRDVTDRAEFVQLVEGRDLTRFGVTLKVSPGGTIAGSAFGRTVRGVWNWQGGFFCRDLSFGSTNLGPNCQQVQVSGATIRFTADQGQGDVADLRLR